MERRNLDAELLYSFDKVSFFGNKDLLSGEGKWYGGVLSPDDGCIYGCP